MCAIIGALVDRTIEAERDLINMNISYIGSKSHQRGRDGWGYHINQSNGLKHNHKSIERSKWWINGTLFAREGNQNSGTMIGNFRAEPTTEFVLNKTNQDQQPYSLNKWNIVHNGTIANDKELRTGEYITRIDSAAIVELLAAAGDITNRRHAELIFRDVILKLKGSYAILATHDNHPDLILAACNYRPIWYTRQDHTIYFASSADYFPSNFAPKMMTPYSCWSFGTNYSHPLINNPDYGNKALIICSGGMDSVVAAAAMKAQKYEIELIHYRYGSRAEAREVLAIQAVADYYGVPVHLIPMNIYDPKDSPLLRSDSTIAGGEAGAEFAHEWVPARNLVMLAMTTAFAEAKGIGTIVLGNNLEEAGAYPDNEPEFIKRFDGLLPFAVGDGRHVRIKMPVGDLMKHEIVAYGHELKAPLHLTWSCYRAGPVHCGTCGPCFMRRTAFEINKLPEVIQYANSQGA